MHGMDCVCAKCTELRRLVLAHSQVLEDALASEPHDIRRCRCQDCKAIIEALKPKSE